MVRVVDTNPLLFGGLPAGISVLVTKKKQRLGDMSTDTYVANTRDLQWENNRISVWWMIFCIAAVIGSIALLVGGIIYGVKNEKGIFAPDKYEVYASANSEFQVTAKDDWSVMNELSEDADISLGNIFSEKYLIVLTEQKTDFDTSITLEEYTTIIDNHFRGNMQR